MKAADIGPVTAIASLPGVGPSRLRILLAAGDPTEVWRRLTDGSMLQEPEVTGRLGSHAEKLICSWREATKSIDPIECARRHLALGFRLLDASDDDYPARFRDDVEPPLMVWVAGDITRLQGPSVAIVGTRRCTRYGHDVARRFGHELAAAGVSVVSGLALGIDAAAHAGALDAADNGAAPVGVVGTGLDVVYPRRNRALWHSVSEHGVLISESPPGAQAEPWRFPARNRLIAALADLVVVVESTDQGGSLYTVDEAIARDVEVRAVPGPVTSPASSGTNNLLADGIGPALTTADLLDAIGVSPTLAPSEPGGQAPGSTYRDPDEVAVLDLLTLGTMTFDDLAERSGLPLERLGLVLAKLQVEGLVARSGGWYERTG